MFKHLFIRVQRPKLEAATVGAVRFRSFYFSQIGLNMDSTKDFKRTLLPIPAKILAVQGVGLYFC